VDTRAGALVPEPEYAAIEKKLDRVLDVGHNVPQEDPRGFARPSSTSVTSDEG
jgi:hypothetical protein